MKIKNTILALILILGCAYLFYPSTQALASGQTSQQQQGSGITAYDLILAMNTLRMANGLPALVEDPIVNSVAQYTAEVMAANQMSWHIGDVRGRIAAAGYGGGAPVFATENFAVATYSSIDQIMVMWADEAHMMPAVNPAYCNVGAGVAQSITGKTYYVLQAAYVSGQNCGAIVSGPPVVSQSGTVTSGAPMVSQLIVPVTLATPDAEGKVLHEVKAGQSFWAIAVAYQVTIDDIATWNNISKTAPLQVGKKLLIPGKDTVGFVTPTPMGMIVPSTPEADGKIYHTVAAYQALSTIADAYKVPVDTILTLNNWNVDWPLQIGQKLLIYPGNVTPSPTPRPLSAIERLTPEADGKYYHTVSSGETISWIANYYSVNYLDLMAWNNIPASGYVTPGQKLVLNVTPPAPPTSTPAPATPTPIPTMTPPATPTHTATLISLHTATPTAMPATSKNWNQDRALGMIILGVVILGGLGVFFFSRKAKNPKE